MGLTRNWWVFSSTRLVERDSIVEQYYSHYKIMVHYSRLWDPNVPEVEFYYSSRWYSHIYVLNIYICIHIHTYINIYNPCIKIHDKYVYINICSITSAWENLNVPGRHGKISFHGCGFFPLRPYPALVTHLLQYCTQQLLLTYIYIYIYSNNIFPMPA